MSTLITEQEIPKQVSNEIQTKIETRTRDLIAWARGLKIISPELYKITAERLKSIKGALVEVDEYFNPDIEKANSLHKSLTGKRKAFKDPLLEAETLAKAELKRWDDLQEADRVKAQAKLDDAAKATETREKAKLEDKAKKAEASGNTEKATELRDQAAAVHVSAAIVQSNVEKISGISYKEDWTAEVTDKKLVPLEYLEPNMKALEAIAKATKGAIQIPGVKFIKGKIVAASK